MKKTILLEQIRIDGNTQTRAKLDDTLLASYTEQYKDDPDQMPEVDVYHDGVDYWLADGFHRFHSCNRAGLKYICAKIHKGDKVEALRHAIGANAIHGSRRTPADLEKSVKMAWENRESLGMGKNPSDQALSVISKCSRQTVSLITKKLGIRQVANPTTCPPPPSPKRQGVDGKMYPVPPQRAIRAQVPVPSPRKAVPVPVNPELRDDAGRRIPVKVFPHLEDLWERKDEAAMMYVPLGNVRLELKNMGDDPFYSGLRLDELIIHLDAVYDALKDCIPYVVCGICNGAGCKCCHGGFQSKGQWNHFVTEENRELILRGEK